MGDRFRIKGFKVSDGWEFIRSFYGFQICQWIWKKNFGVYKLNWKEILCAIIFTKKILIKFIIYEIKSAFKCEILFFYEKNLENWKQLFIVDEFSLLAMNLSIFHVCIKEKFYKEKFRSYFFFFFLKFTKKFNVVWTNWLFNRKNCFFYSISGFEVTVLFDSKCCGTL